MSGTPHHSEESEHDQDSQIELLMSLVGRDELPMPATSLGRVKQIARETTSLDGSAVSESRTTEPHVTIMKPIAGLPNRITGVRKMFVARTIVSMSALVVAGLAAMMFSSERHSGVPRFDPRRGHTVRFAPP